MGLGLPSVLPINRVKIQVKQKGRQFEKNPYLCRTETYIKDRHQMIEGQTLLTQISLTCKFN